MGEMIENVLKSMVFTDFLFPTQLKQGYQQMGLTAKYHESHFSNDRLLEKGEDRVRHNLTKKESKEEEYWKGMQQGKRRILTLERIRQDTTCMRDILSADHDMVNWWDSIDVR